MSRDITISPSRCHASGTQMHALQQLVHCPACCSAMSRERAPTNNPAFCNNHGGKVKQFSGGAVFGLTSATGSDFLYTTGNGKYLMSTASFTRAVHARHSEAFTQLSRTMSRR
jgi:hypothetical protein